MNWLKYSSSGVLVAVIALSVMHFSVPTCATPTPQIIGRPIGIWLGASGSLEDHSGFLLSNEGLVQFAEDGLSFKQINLQCDPPKQDAPGFKHCKVLNWKP